MPSVLVVFEFFTSPTYPKSKKSCRRKAGNSNERAYYTHSQTLVEGFWLPQRLDVPSMCENQQNISAQIIRVNSRYWMMWTCCEKVEDRTSCCSIVANSGHTGFLVWFCCRVLCLGNSARAVGSERTVRDTELSLKAERVCWWQIGVQRNGDEPFFQKLLCYSWLQFEQRYISKQLC